MNINKQKVLNFVLTLEAGGRQNSPKLSLKYLKDYEKNMNKNMKNQTIFELYTDDNKSKYSSNPMNIVK